MIAPVAAQTLSDAEADRIVAEEMAELAARQAAITPDYTVLSESTRSIGDKAVIIRKVLPPEVPETPLIENTLEEDEIEQLIEYYERRGQLERRTLSMGIRVFDDAFSEILYWRDGRTIRICSNVAFRYLSPFGEIETDGALYSLVALVSETTLAEVQMQAARMRERGFPVENTILPNADLFSGIDPEYLVYRDSEEEIPDELFRDMDALHRYYLTHEAELTAKAQRAMALANAQKRYEEEHPKPDGPTVITVWYTETSQIGEVEQ